MRPLVVAILLFSVAGPDASARVADAPIAPRLPHLVGAPVVAFFHASPSPETNIWFTTVVRVDRPLPQGPRGIGAAISVSGATHDIPGIAHLAGVQRCYWQDNPVASSRRLPRDGQQVTVTLDIDGALPRVAVVRARELPAGRQLDLARAARRLGCPPAPPEQRCHGAVAGVMGIGLAAAGGGATCATARRVLGAAGRWANSGRCFETLCVGRHRMNLGYRCTVAVTGEAAWSITCRRGRRVVRGYTAE